MRLKKAIILVVLIILSYKVIDKILESKNYEDSIQLLSLPYLEYSTDRADSRKTGLIYSSGETMEGYVVTEKYIIDRNGRLYDISSENPDLAFYFGRIISKDYSETLENAGLKYFLHHDVYQLNNSNLLVLAKESRIFDGEPMLFDRIIEIDKSGNEVYSFDTFERINELKKLGSDANINLKHPIYFEEDAKKIKTILNLTYLVSNDYFHANTVYEIQENKNSYDPRFKKGNILVTFLFLNLVIIIDKDDDKIVWSYGPGETLGQHAATMLDNGNIILFDNGNMVERNKSRVLEINPLDSSIVWEYSYDSFFSESQGFVQRLKNNNTLITESTKGRIFEVNPKKEIVWEYYMPILNEKGEREVIYRAIKIPTDFLDLNKQKFAVVWEPNKK